MGDPAGRPLSIGVKLVPQDTTLATLRAFWHHADASGFDHLWVYEAGPAAGTAAVARRHRREADAAAGR